MGESAYPTAIADNSFVSVKGNPVCSGCVGSVVVSPQHPALSVVDGVLFDKDQKRLIAYPGSREESGYTILCIDAAQTGIGSNSCGPALQPQYRLEQETLFLEASFTFL